MRNSLRRGGLLAATALVLTIPTVMPAQADPGFTPDANDIVGVGSDTTEFVVQSLAGAFNTAGVGGTQRMASFNATGSATIVPRSGASAITRPNGSSAGIAELRSNTAISFARSSRGPNASGDTGTIFFPYATDKLGYVYAKPGSHAKLNMTAANLKSIYTCSKTNWSQFGMPAGHILAKVPQAGSGTRSFFLASIGETETQLQNAIAKPNATCSVIQVQEHDPNAVIGKVNAVAPFSFARFKTLSASVKTHIGYASSAPFNVTRDVYNVIRTGNAGALAKYFNDTSWICTSTKAGQVITAKGFTRLPASTCGDGVVAP
jgi:ABC-type phosphate transport system substrate-binding protein